MSTGSTTSAPASSAPPPPPPPAPPPPPPPLPQATQQRAKQNADTALTTYDSVAKAAQDAGNKAVAEVKGKIADLQALGSKIDLKDKARLEALLQVQKDIDALHTLFKGAVDYKVINPKTVCCQLLQGGNPISIIDFTGELKNKTKQVQSLIGDFEQSVSQWFQQAQASKNLSQKEKLYLGRFHDVEDYANSAQTDLKKEIKNSRRLNAKDWNLGVNEAFISGGVAIDARFKFKTELSTFAKEQLAQVSTGENFLNAVAPKKGEDAKDKDMWDAKNARPTVFAREIAQLLDQGYRFEESDRKGKHAGEKKQQMLPPTKKTP